MYCLSKMYLCLLLRAQDRHRDQEPGGRGESEQFRAGDVSKIHCCHIEGAVCCMAGEEP